MADLCSLRASLSGALVALDFDGTLAPLMLHPDDARPLKGAVEVLHELRGRGATVAVVTGRTVESLLRLSGFDAVPGIIVYGTHGVERWQAGDHLRAPSPPPGLDKLRDTLPGLLASLSADPDLWIEDKNLSLVIHARLTPDPDALLEVLRAPVTAAAAAVGLGVRPGKEVLEICIPGIDKGTAIRELLRPETTAAFYAGDDLSDRAAIAAVQAWANRTGRPGLTVGVGSGGGGGGSSSGGGAGGSSSSSSTGSSNSTGGGGGGSGSSGSSSSSSSNSTGGGSGGSGSQGPLVGRTDLTVPDPQSLVALLGEITRGR